MAVTYSWRLDSNKFAYILPPEELSVDAISREYGYLSNHALVGTTLESIAHRAEERFGKGAENGLLDYQIAFGYMYEKIIAADTTISGNTGHTQQFSGSTFPDIYQWPGASHYDLLSADVYYNVDAAECANLKGVGISSVQYLGSITGKTWVDYNISEEGLSEVTQGTYTYINNYSSPDIAIPSGTTTENILMASKGTQIDVEFYDGNGELQTQSLSVTQGIPGFTDVYGIYFSDTQLDENGELPTPDDIFLVRNGKDGLQTEININIPDDSAFNVLEEYIDQIQDDVNSVDDRIGLIENALSLNTSEGSIFDRLTALEEKVFSGSTEEPIDESLQNLITNLQNKIATLEEQVNDLINNGSSSGGGSDIKIVTLSTNDFINESEGFAIDGVSNEASYFKPSDNLYVLGTYLPTEKAYENNNDYRASNIVEYLFALPYIKLNGKSGVTIDKLNVVNNVRAKAFYQDTGIPEIKDENFNIITTQGDIS